MIVLLGLLGQYEDIETGLYYNRFRYYNPDAGTYISQDPIGLEGGMPNMYSYVPDVNRHIDIFGLSCSAAQRKAKTRTNLIDLKTPFHGNHPKYNDFVKNELRNLKKTEGKLTPENVSKLQNDLRDLIGEAQNSGSTLNEFFKGLL